MDESGDKQMKEGPETGDKHMKECLEWILMVSMSPIAFLIFVLMALYGLLRFFCKAALLFVIVAINTPFAVMYNVSNIVFKYNYARLQELLCYVRLQKLPCYAHLQESLCVCHYRNWSNGRGNVKTNVGDWNWSDPRVNMGIEVKLFVSDFLKVVAGELLLLFSTGIITYYTAPRKVFYISTAVWVVAIFHKWLNSPCLSKTVLSIICDCFGLSPMTFLYSYIGFFDIGCHPIAKCSFTAEKAFLFVKDASNQLNKEPINHQFSSIVCLKKSLRFAPFSRPLEKPPTSATVSRPASMAFSKPPEINNEDLEKGNKECNATENNTKEVIKFSKWNAFERGLFELSPRIKFIKRDKGKYILETFMVLKLRKGWDLCEYPVERLELPEDYSKVNELYNFLVTLSKANGFVTKKMGGRYEHSLTLWEIVEGVQEHDKYGVVDPKDGCFVVA